MSYFSSPFSTSLKIIASFLLIFTISACKFGFEGDEDEPQVRNSDNTQVLIEDNKASVNPYLWRAALETLDFFPLRQTDYSGGVIITDWYVNPDVANERFRANITILDRKMRVDALDVTIFRQIYGRDKVWVSAPTDANTATEIKDAILTKARELKIGVLSQK